MSELMKANVEEGTYFVTFAVVGWVDVFTRKEYVGILFDSLEFCRKHKGLELFEYVVMPSHVHLLARRKAGLLSDVIRDMKSFTAKKLLDAIAQNERESRREWMMDLQSTRP
jgi:REP element-mobilizing transposase RayT